MQGDRTASWVSDYRAAELIEAAPVGIILTDAAKHCIYANRHWYQVTGLTPDSGSGDGWLRSLHRDDRTRALEWATPTSEAREFTEEFRFESDGSVNVVAARVLPLIDETRGIGGYLCAVTDLTKERETEQALRKLTHDLRERVKELNCLFGLSHIVEHSGGSLARILRETARLVAASWEHSDVACARVEMGGLEFETENCVDTPWKMSAEILVHGKPSGSIEVGYLEERPEHDEGPFLAEERTLIDAIAERLGRVAERIRAEQRVDEREQELRERLTHLTRVSVMGEMASGIAHEVSQPLTAVSTYAQACRRLLDAGMTDKTLVLDVLDRISKEALRAGEVLHRLKDLIRKRESERVYCDVGALIRGIENLAEIDGRLHDIRVLFELDDALPEAAVDEIQIQQVILNLIRNGIDATEEGDPDDRDVIVRATRVDDDIRISVTDHGCGLPEDADYQMFQPFYTTKEAGIGMGLSISRSIVTAHGGQMWFSRNPDGGTTFYFTIPIGEKENHVED